MKIKTVEPKFNPISIVLETPEEVAKIYAILNHTGIIKALDIVEEANKIRGSISGAFNDVYETSMPWYNKLVDTINGKNNINSTNKKNKKCTCGIGFDHDCDCK